MRSSWRSTSALEVVVPGAVWVREYAVGAAGAKFNARMTVIKVGSGDVLVHSPGPFDASLAAEVEGLGRVAAIIAPGNLHWLHVRSCQQRFPDAKTFVCPGVEKRARRLLFDFVLNDAAPSLWADELAQVLLRGTRGAREVAFFHRVSRTLILVDLVENFTPATPGTNLFLRTLVRALGMWNHPSPAPEYRLGWGDKRRVREALERILEWDFDRVVLSHGDMITRDAKQVVAQAWGQILR